MEEEKMNEHITLAPGEHRKIKISFAKSVHLVYCGMPSKDSFSVGYFRGEGNRGYGLNMYYPKDAKMITIDTIPFRVIHVSPEQLTLQQDIMQTSSPVY
jgi:hypothetical protein